MNYELSCSIVAYKNEKEVLGRAVNSVLKCNLNLIVYVYDNSPTDELKGLFLDPRVIYIHDPSNVGFGKGHNYCIKQLRNQSNAHLILNPDVFFEEGVIENLYKRISSDPSIGLIAPKVNYPDGKVQYSCRLLPHPVDLLIRRIPFLSSFYKDRLKMLDLDFTGYNSEMEVPFILGCFLLCPMELLTTIGGFDENFYIYMEDFDLVRRIKKNHKVLFCPDVEIYHYYDRGSGKKLRLVIEHLKSAYYYFNKWGWFVDSERDKFNKEILRKFNYGK